MMKKVYLLAIFLCFAADSILAQELFVRNDKYFTEIYLKINTSEIRSVDRKDNSVEISFSKNIKKSFSQNFDDQFIMSVSAEKNIFKINFKPGTEYTVVNDIAGIKIAAARKKTNSDILSSYRIGNPRLTKDSTSDKIQEEALNRADSALAGKKFHEAAQILNNIIETSKNDFYRQEAFYRLGQTYLIMAQYDDQYLLNAYNTFDDFIKLYPDNFRVADALMKSAETKEKANQLFEAVFTYEKIYNSIPDLDAKRNALVKMAEIYETVGQKEKSIDTYKRYLKQFRTENDKVNYKIGRMYYDEKEMDFAYEYFSRLNLDKLLLNPTIQTADIYAIAKNMETKKQYDKALKLYSVIYEKYSDAKEANDSIFSSAEILDTTNRKDEADELLLKLRRLFPDRMTGQQAAIEYAKKYLGTKSYSYWKDFLGDLLSRPDDFGFHEEALYMLLKSMHRENNREGVIVGVASFLNTYQDSKHREELDKMREDFMFARASEIFNDGRRLEAEPFLTGFLSEYPESSYKPRVDSMLLDIKFAKAQGAYDALKYKDVIKDAEAHIAENPNSKELVRWFEILDNARYKDLSIKYTAEDWPLSRVEARQYLAFNKEGRHRKAVYDILENSFMIPLEKAFRMKDYMGAASLYDSSREWIDIIQSKAVRDRAALIAGLSLYRMGSEQRASALYSQITPDQSEDYALLGLLLGDKTKNFDVNIFDEETFKYIEGELESKNPEAALSLIKQYKKNPKLAYSMEYTIAKNTSGDARRQELILEIYEAVSSNESAHFDGYEEVYLDAGILYFRKNDFQTAVIPLKKYSDIHRDKDDKRSEALYYLGKSFINMNDQLRGFQYYNEIIETIPSSIYAGIAKSEMDEDNWKNNLNRF